MTELIQAQRAERSEEFNVRVNPELQENLLALPAFAHATDGALIAAAQRRMSTRLGALSGIRISSRILAIAFLIGTRSLDDAELFVPVATL